MIVLGDPQITHIEYLSQYCNSKEIVHQNNNINYDEVYFIKPHEVVSIITLLIKKEVGEKHSILKIKLITVFLWYKEKHKKWLHPP